MRKFFPVLFLLLSLQTAALGKEKTCTIQSPDGRLELTVTCGERIVYNVRTENERVVSSDGVALELADGRTWGLSSHVKRVQHYLLDEQVPAPFYKRSQVADRCNGLLVEFREGFALEFRLYDDGMAYRFLSRTDDEVTLRGERAPFLFPEGSTAARRAPLRRAVHAVVREYLYRDFALRDGLHAAGLPAAAGPHAGRRAGLHHRCRPGELSRHVPPTCGRRPARGCLCPLPAAHRCGRLRPHAGRRRGVRTLHRPHCGAADAPLAGDGAGAQRRGAGPDRPGVASGLPLPAGQHLVD